jgi:xanthine dehydrogenase large subunit
VDSGGQEHFYMEPQGALTLPTEGDGIKIMSSTQSPTGVQRIAAIALALPMHRVEVDVARLGGAFGGKEDQATPWAVLAAMAAFILKKPVKLILDRREDMLATGKRHPYSSDYKIGLDEQGKILAYEATLFQNAGAAADLSTAILERSLLHAANSYYIPNVKVTAVSCRTNLPPFTAFRGFGAPQAMFVIEAAIRKAAESSGKNPSEIQEKNLLQEHDTFPYGMRVENCRAGRCFAEADKRYGFAAIFSEVEKFNAAHTAVKKGAALMPVCFGISFTNSILNQAGALVHVYTDGSVGVSTGAVEMGQGVNMKILQIAAHTFSIDSGRVKVETTNTSRVANTSPTAASSGADMNGKAAQIACLSILDRLKKVAAAQLGQAGAGDIEIKNERVYCRGKETGITWPELISKAYISRTNLSAQGYYATPGIYFDRDKEKGKPFAYHVFGTAVTEVTLDCVRGTYEIDSVRIVHDAGRSLDFLIDKGQVEGALLQGIGWLTIEELLFTEEGRLLSNSAGTYKFPDIKFTPKEVEVHFLENADNPYAVLKSKAVGEPPFMYGIGTYFAIMAAAKAFRPGKEFPIHAPLTPEKVLGFLYEN